MNTFLHLLCVLNRGDQPGTILMATFLDEDVQAGKTVSDKVRLRVEVSRLKK